MERDAQPSAVDVREENEVLCSAPHPLFGLGVALVLVAIVGGLVYLLGR